jgi:hypothetical protein
MNFDELDTRMRVIETAHDHSARWASLAARTSQSMTEEIFKHGWRTDTYYRAGPFRDRSDNFVLIVL